MQQAVVQCFPNETVEYKFYNRRPDTKFSRLSFDWFSTKVQELSKVKLSKDERTWLETKCPYFQATYLDFLQNLRLSPEDQVTAHFVPVSADEVDVGDVEITVKGLWKEVILYEVPLMALLSEAFFLHTDTDWTIDSAKDNAKSKAASLLAHGIAFSEFGTRRRRSYEVHDLVLRGLLEGQSDAKSNGYSGAGRLAGTSNVHFAHKYDLNPVGTIAHEWTMGIAALKGYTDANPIALDLWESVYPPSPTSPLHTALTDTFSTPIFFSTFTADRARAWRGLRQDSGDPIEYANLAKETYDRLGVDMKDKFIVFSDGLDVKTCVDIQKACKEIQIGATFGIGTFLTNDFHRASDSKADSKALNIVIKLSIIDGTDCVKISDDLNKNTGKAEVVAAAKKTLQI
ncbi:nicotinate phosphoribosyltransferase [Phaffia rhodozyma]|uniref:Nicotinate phosphoribosyltransferase n=1 Tax=Phaffia rhodozyma TaxID=264483 RepID=A0A0F7SKF2_PHARH|nr:nicotinate phosphoribosyltransferase [Phaffia rhodozyma]